MFVYCVKHLKNDNDFWRSIIYSLFNIIMFAFQRCFLIEAHRALELLEDYHSKLTQPGDRPLRNAIERVIRIFKSRLFQALLGEWVTAMLYSDITKTIVNYTKAADVAFIVKK